MSYTVFRTNVEQPKPEVLPEGKEPDRAGDEGEPEVVPYLDYEREHGHPYSVDYFKLGDTWEDPTGGFPKELSIIEEYMQEKIESGELANSVKAIEEEYKNLEKVTGVKKEERPVVKIETIAAYIEFLMKTAKTKYNLRRYGKYGNN